MRSFGRLVVERGKAGPQGQAGEERHHAKRRYDPDNLFRRNQKVDPTG